MRRICCFCECWESGGIESFLNNVLLHMDLSEMEVAIVAACIKESVFTAGLKEKGIRFIELSGKLRSPQNYRIFRELLRERKYDVAHFNLFQGLSLYYVQIAKEEKIPVRIAHSHNTALRKSNGRWIKMWLHKLGRSKYTDAATDLWACSEVAAEFLFSAKKLAKTSYQFIPNGIETERFKFNQSVRDAVRSELGLADAFVIGNVGRLCYQKNQDFLLDVFVEMLEHKPECRLLLVGEGEQEPYLKEKANRLGIAEHVIFCGVTNRVEQLYWAMDVFVFPSLFEGLGIVAVEAQASGLPVICSEFVPTQARVTELFQPLALTKGVSSWAEQLCKAKKATDRAQYAQVVADAGFHVDAVSKLIQQEYSR